jgi:hypothetical protein
LVKVKGNTPKSLKQFSALESSLYDGYWNCSERVIIRRKIND